jgi:hypothetical protein
MIDRIGIVYELLTTASTLFDEVGTRVFSPVAPSNGFDGNASAIVFHQSDGAAHLTGATNSATFVFKCYGDANTHTKAHEVFRLLYDRLQQRSETVASGKILTARLETDFQIEPDADTNYKAHLAQFSIMFEG